jgi:hypothetical protein
MAGAGLLGAVPHSTAQTKQVVTGPVAQYWIGASTKSGFGGMASGKPSMRDMMNMMRGGDSASHSLRLGLGSSQKVAGATSATHTPPAGLDGGKILPLLYTPPKAGQATDYEPGEQTDYEPPKGKILIFWGCGEKARPGQPVEIDLSKLTDPKARMDSLAALSKSITLDTAKPPRPSASASYGEWPNAKDTRSFTTGDSLVGAHTIKGNFTPDINFTLSQAQDFMPPVQVTQNAPLPSGAVQLGWRPVTGAKGQLAHFIGGSGDEGRGATVVFWSSSEIQNGWMAMGPEYLTPSDVTRLLTQKVLMPAATTTCAVPSEAIKAAPQGLYTITAYGGEANFSYPPRPEDPKVAWNIQWTTKVRYKSSTSGLLGQDMGDMMGAAEEDEPKPGQKKKKGGIMGDMLKQGLGF